MAAEPIVRIEDHAVDKASDPRNRRVLWGRVVEVSCGGGEVGRKEAPCGDISGVHCSGELHGAYIEKSSSGLTGALQEEEREDHAAHLGYLR